ncbi:MAG: hypothetical protein JNJ46_30035 [Myxococcales bacterium]|nr:hypothetical protein [Myxococcales bacterium]
MVAFHSLVYRPAEQTLPSLSLAADRSRLAHVPFLQSLLEILQPHVYVELGADLDSTYLAACQTVVSTGLSCLCYGLPAMEGEQYVGRWPAQQALRVEQAGRFSAFSCLGDSDESNDEANVQALRAMPPVDLLWIEGRRTYQAIAQDVARFRARLSPRGVVLIHGTDSLPEGCGAGRLWLELAAQHPNLRVPHGEGLGVLAMGREIPEPLHALLSLPGDAAAGAVALYQALGERLTLQADLGQARDELQSRVPMLQAAHQAAQQARDEKDRVIAASRQQIAALERERDALHIAESELRDRVRALEATLVTLNQCLSFRIGMAATAPLRWMKKRLHPATETP